MVTTSATEPYLLIRADAGGFTGTGHVAYDGLRSGVST